MSEPMVDELGAAPALAELTAEQRHWLVEHGEFVEFQSGDTIFEVGAVAHHMVLVVSGAIEILFSVGGQPLPAFVQRAGTFTGMLPFSRMRTYSGSGRALGPTRVYQIHQSKFDEMLHVAPQLGPRLVALMTDRVRETTTLVQQREKMVALGKLSAGLAHELNNPAAAVRRDADALWSQLARLPELTWLLLASGADAEILARAKALLASVTTARDGTPVSDVLERNRLEQRVGDWLDQHGIPESWTLAEPLAGAGLDTSHLRDVTSGLDSPATAALVQWLAAVLDSQRLSGDIRASAGRISELVGSVKIYSHMDRSNHRERLDLSEGLESTLVMLGHKIKRKNITLELVYDDDLPRVNGLPGELNQVWTNLADNAIDAMADHGVLRIEVARDGDGKDEGVIVRFIDNGPGIPPEVRAHIFDAFFTTKPAGDGTGLGLDIVQRVVVQQHSGSVDVESAPGRTVFSVRLPVGD